MSKGARGDKPSSTRVVGYRWGWTHQVSFDESKMEVLLKKAQEAGTVTQFDTGRGTCLWINGVPGSAMRALIKTVRSMLSPDLPSEKDQ